jgi:hypothetical protein
MTNLDQPQLSGGEAASAPPQVLFEGPTAGGKITLKIKDF